MNNILEIKQKTAKKYYENVNMNFKLNRKRKYLVK